MLNANTSGLVPYTVTMTTPVWVTDGDSGLPSFGSEADHTSNPAGLKAMTLQHQIKT